jgi:hypothetical protein
MGRATDFAIRDVQPPEVRAFHTQSPDDILICGATVQAIGPLAKWPGANPSLPWYLDTAGYRGQLTAAAVLAAYDRAWAYWAAVVEIDPKTVADAGAALIRAHFARIDGPSNVLAWSELADNSNRPKTQRYDAGDDWVITPEGQTPSGGIDLVRVACHEIGHVLGLDHDNANADALLRPSYSTRIPKPTARDVQRLIGLGYKPRTTAPVPPAPFPPKPPTVPDPPPVGPPVPVPDLGQITVDLTRRTVYVPAGWKIQQPAQ